MTAATALVLVLTAVLVVLLLVHRTDGDLARAVAEYAVVALLAMLLAFTPATSGATGGLTAGVASGSASAGRLLADAWHAAVTHDPNPLAPAPPATTAPKPGHHRQPARRAAPTASSAPARASHPSGQHAGVPLRLLLALVVVLGLLLLAARRLRRLDERDALDLGLARLPRRRGRGHVA
jgi:hypothetical protein